MDFNIGDLVQINGDPTFTPMYLYKYNNKIGKIKKTNGFDCTYIKFKGTRKWVGPFFGKEIRSPQIKKEVSFDI